MWRLWHKLFGWHYIMFSYAFGTRVARVRTLLTGERYVKTFGDFLVINKDFTFKNKSGTWYPLTWKPEPENEKDSE